MCKECCVNNLIKKYTLIDSKGRFCENKAWFIVDKMADKIEDLQEELNEVWTKDKQEELNAFKGALFDIKNVLKIKKRK